MLFHIAKLYARFVKFSIRYLNYSPPGLGYLLRKVKSTHIININGRKFLFSRWGASMYGLMILNEYRETETHIFLNEVIKRSESGIAFIDVGAAIGEIVIDVAGYDKITKVFAIDPDEDNIRAIEESAKLNNFKNIEVICKVISDREHFVNFVFNRNRGKSGYIEDKEHSGSDEVKATTIDNLFETVNENLKYIMLIDTEGAELRVIKGSTNFIKKVKPLIIFEFNKKTQKYFTLDDMRNVLGNDYTIYRLNNDGKLDSNFKDIWNCVAISSESYFYNICKELIIE